MSRSKDLKSYPPQLHTLAARFSQDRSEWKALYKEKRMAETLRFRIYGFKNALRHSGSEEMYGDFVGTTVVIKQEGDGWACIVRMPEDSDVFKGLDFGLTSAPAGSGITGQGTETGRWPSTERVESNVPKGGDAFEELMQKRLSKTEPGCEHEWRTEDLGVLVCNKCGLLRDVMT